MSKTKRSKILVRFKVPIKSYYGLCGLKYDDWCFFLDDNSLFPHIAVYVNGKRKLVRFDETPNNRHFVREYVLR